MNVTSFEFRTVEIVDGFTVKRYGLRCYNLLLETGFTVW